VSAVSDIRWPERHRPEDSSFLAVNEIQIAAPVERVWAWLTRPDLWPSYYGNARLVRHREGPWPEVGLGTRFRWLTFGVIVQSEIVEYEPELGRVAWSARELGASGHHGWLLDERDGGTLVRTEETQRGPAMAVIKPVMKPLMLRFHQRWLEGLARVAAEGPPPPPGA
jgi:uncharacterized protein YndB with AHSA1/START domain